MHDRTRSCSTWFRLLLLISFVSRWVARAGADTNASATNSATDVEGRNAEAVVIGTQENLRSSLQIQEELHKTQLAIERNRQDAEAEAVRQNEILEARLKLIEQSIATQRLDELKDL